MNERDFERDKDNSRGYSRDMSPEAIDKRLRIVSELHDFSIKMGKGKRSKKESSNNS